MARLTGGEALVQALIANGVDTVFAVPGVQLDHLFNALYDARDAIRVVHARHEQGAAYMAFGYAQASGRVGALAVVPGPGFLNATAALSTAFACNSPVLCLAGQIPSRQIGRGFGALHEIADQSAIARVLTKWSARIRHPLEVAPLMERAFVELGSGRRRPVAIEVAPDVLAETAEVGAAVVAATVPAPPVDPAAIEAAATLLAKAEAPMIVVGGGAMGAGAEIVGLAERLRAPIVPSRNGLGCVDSRHPRVAHPLALAPLWERADVVLAVGTRLVPQLTQWQGERPPAIVRVDIDPEEMARARSPEVALVGDARTLMRVLTARMSEGTVTVQRDNGLDALNRRSRALVAELEPQVAYLNAIRAALPDDGILVEDLTQVGYVARLAFPVYAPRTYITPGYQGTLGYGFATAMGAKVGAPTRKVVTVCGDGGFMFNVQELAAAVLHRIAIVAVVFNDNAYGNVRRMQVQDYDGRVIATDLRNPDFVRLAEIFGALGLRAHSPEELGAALKRAFAADGPVIIEVPVGEMPDPWKLLMMTPSQSRKAFASSR